MDTIRSRDGRLLANLETQSNGDIRVRDRFGELLGHYCKAMDVTFDRHGEIVARGNCIGMLIKER